MLEQPRLLKRALELLVEAKGYEFVLEKLPYMLPDLERLTGASPALFRKDTGIVLTLKPQAASTDGESNCESNDENNGDKLGEIFQFRRR